MAQPVTIVVVDDADDVRRVVELNLRLSGKFEVVGVGTTGNDAISLAENSHPQIMLLDVSMPDMDGLIALPSILKVSPDTCVVMLSGFSSVELERRATELGAAVFIDKGIPLGELPSRLLQILDEQPKQQNKDRIDTRTIGQIYSDDDVLTRHLERFRTVFDQAAIGMATMTRTGTIVRTNAVFARLHGTEEASVVGHNYSSLSVDPDIDRVQRAISRVGNGAVNVLDIEHALSIGERFIHSTFAAVLDDNGSPLYIFAQAEDMTPRREAAEKLRASEERFRLLVEGVQDYAIFMLDPDGLVSTWNLGAERMKGYRSEEIIGQHFRVFYPEEAQQAKHPEYELSVAVREGRYEEEGVRVRKDGSRFFANVLITAIFDQNGRLAGFAKVTRNVTDQHLNTEARERAASELQGANESLQNATTAMAQFVAMVAHELRSPITTITGATTLLEKHWEKLNHDERKEMLSSIESSGEQLQILVNDLLTASRLEAGSFEFTLTQIPVADALGHILAELPAGQGQGIEVHCDQDILLWGDRARFAQIVSNLISNATKYGAPPISVDVAKQGKTVEIQICDHGKGVPDSLVGRVFEKFARGRDDRGTGLGLFIVRELARGQGGDAWYEATGGQTCFAISLPASGEVR